jgi:hypothetical protein
VYVGVCGYVLALVRARKFKFSLSSFIFLILLTESVHVFLNEMWPNPYEL